MNYKKEINYLIYNQEIFRLIVGPYGPKGLSLGIEKEQQLKTEEL